MPHSRSYPFRDYGFDMILHDGTRNCWTMSHGGPTTGETRNHGLVAITHDHCRPRHILMPSACSEADNTDIEVKPAGSLLF